jgi:glutamate dehydrogenase
MGITARGAWESVKRHFRELGVDTQSENFTVVGIGDMAGDVFGNGMLLSEHIRLVAAFNHMHVFLDPDPDAAATFRERKRLFELPRSSWDDYDRSLISEGGGIYPRSAKTIPVTPQVRSALGLADDITKLSPAELIRSILLAPVDLLWNGGIGTYVKAAEETHADAGDKANDAVRVNGQDLRVKVVGEGGNLGLTQLGRIEFARTGGKINTDALDNSAGVDCSDHEVNIKILLGGAVADDDITRKHRNTLLATMTDEVAELVLDNNRQQSQALANATAQATSMLDVHIRYIRSLEQAGTLDRHLEHLPSEEQLADRMAADQGLTAPEFAVLMAYTKLAGYRELLTSDVPDDPYLDRVLTDYFPSALSAEFPHRLQHHPLRREIIATQVANHTVNRAGTTFAFRMAEETGQTFSEIARANLAATDMFGLDRLSRQVLQCTPTLSAPVQTRLLLEVRKLAERATRWLLRNLPLPLPLQATVSAFAPGLQVLARHLPDLVADAQRQTIRSKTTTLLEDGVPEDLATTLAGLDELFSGLDIAHIARTVQQPVEQVATVYFQLADTLDLGWLRQKIAELPRNERWRSRARAALRDDLYREHAALTTKVLHTNNATAPTTIVERWTAANTTALTCLCVGLRELRNLV